MEILIKNKTYKADSFRSASDIYSAQREKSGQGASKFPFGVISDKGSVVALISYNGKVWKACSTKEIGNINKNELLYNPFE